MYEAQSQELKKAAKVVPPPSENEWYVVHLMQGLMNLAEIQFLFVKMGSRRGDMWWKRAGIMADAHGESQITKPVH